MAKRKTVSVAVWKMMCEELKGMAKGGKVASYGEFGKKYGFYLSEGYYENTSLWYILGEFTEAEHELGHPMISAMIQRADTNLPGNGFFLLAESLHPKLKLNTAEKKVEFYCQELNRLFDFWKNHS